MFKKYIKRTAVCQIYVTSRISVETTRLWKTMNLWSKKRSGMKLASENSQCNHSRAHDREKLNIMQERSTDWGDTKTFAGQTPLWTVLIQCLVANTTVNCTCAVCIDRCTWLSRVRSALSALLLSLRGNCLPLLIKLTLQLRWFWLENRRLKRKSVRGKTINRKLRCTISLRVNRWVTASGEENSYFIWVYNFVKIIM